jgi:hypothetical protein
VKTKWIICPLVAIYLYYRGETAASMISLLWPIFPYVTMIPGVNLVALLVMPPAPVRPVQDRFMMALGYVPNYLSRAEARLDVEGVEKDLEISPAVFQQIYVRAPGANYGPEAEEVVDLLATAGIGVGIPTNPLFWQNAATAANELRVWLKQNPMATAEARTTHARKVVDMNRLVDRSLRSG